MIDLPVIHYDCLHFFGDRPCFPNKEYGVFCDNCSYYEKDYNITAEFPAVPLPPPAGFDEGEKKIIIVKLDAVGDVLRTTSILPSLKEKYTDSSVTWITKERSFEVLKDNEMIDEIYFDSDELEHVYNDLFDIAINLDSGKESCAIMNEISAKEKYGYELVNGKPYPVNKLGNEWYLMGVNDNVKKQNRKTYHRIIHEICGIEYYNTQPFLGFPGEKITRAKELKEKYSLERFNEFILVNLGGGNRWQYKKWTKEGYIEVISQLSFLKPRAAVGVIAGDEDRNFYNEIKDVVTKDDAGGDNIIFFGCDNTIEDFISIIYLADKVLTSDSLAFHIATALGKQTVAIVGPTSYTELDVFGSGEIIYSDKVDCLCCYLNKCSKLITCMNTVTPQQVLNHLI